jgi:hypothetical protein
MSEQITLTLPNKIYERAEGLAQRTGRDVAEVLTSMLEVSLPSDPLMTSPKPIDSLSDEEILALTASQMDSAQNARMSDLLVKQQASKLDEVEQQELSLLLHVYQEGSLRKARALVEAVRRGLRKPLKP